jgi:hypothetical protein
MGITGSQLAPTQNRAGIGRAGATRAGYYRPNLIIKINGTDRVRFIELATLEIEDRSNHEPSLCRCLVREGVTITPGLSFVVAMGYDALGTRLFTGSIRSVTRVQPVTGQAITYEVTAVDHVALLDRRLVTAAYTGESATDIAIDLIATYTTGGFTANRVEPDLPTIDYVEFINERPSVCLTTLVKLIQADLPNATWVIDEAKDLNLPATDEYYNPDPPALTSSATHFWDLLVTPDLSQVRTRIIAEGRSQKVMIDVPAGETSIPIEYGWGFPSNGTPAPPLTPYVRFGVDVLLFGSVTHILGPPASLVTADAAVGDTSIAIASSTGFSSAGWAHDAGGNLFKYSSTTATSLTGIPASGYGSIVTAIKADTPVYEQDRILLSVVTPRDLTTGDMATYRLVVDDTTAQAAVAALEGGDGIHEHLIVGEHWEAGPLASLADAAAQAALAELAAFGAAVTSVQFKTRHPSYIAGRTVTIQVGGVNEDFVIQDVVINGFDQLAPITSHSRMVFPIRTVTAAPLRMVSLMNRLES